MNNAQYNQSMQHASAIDSYERKLIDQPECPELERQGLPDGTCIECGAEGLPTNENGSCPDCGGELEDPRLDPDYQRNETGKAR